MVDFVNILDIQLQLKDVSFIGSWDWNKLITMVSNELITTIGQFSLLWPLMMIFKIDEFGTMMDPEILATSNGKCKISFIL